MSSSLSGPYVPGGVPSVKPSIEFMGMAEIFAVRFEGPLFFHDTQQTPTHSPIKTRDSKRLALALFNARDVSEPRPRRELMYSSRMHRLMTISKKRKLCARRIIRLRSARSGMPIDKTLKKGTVCDEQKEKKCAQRNADQQLIEAQADNSKIESSSGIKPSTFRWWRISTTPIKT